MSKTLLLLEGGAYRGIFTAGVLDVFLEHDLYFDAVAGISAGAMCGYHFVGRCHGRIRQVMLEYGNDPRYFSTRNLLRSGNSIGDEFMFFDLMEKIPFDFRTFRESKTVFAVGATNCRTGETEFFEKGKCSDMISANDEVKQGFANLGTEANNSVEVPDCETAVKQLCSANEGHINEAVSAAQALIDKLDGEIADLRSQRALAVEGRDYSNGRAEMYRGYAASTRTAIANYSED